MTDETTEANPRPSPCPDCRSRRTVRNGRHRETNAQKVLCRNCGRSFRERYRYRGVRDRAALCRRTREPAWLAHRRCGGTLRTVPIGLREANAFVLRHHRHHPPVVGHLFSIGLSDGDALVGVIIVGRPVSRMLDDGRTAEVTRCCTTGRSNACSMLYGAARRAAFALGYARVVTYTLASEPGTSLKAAGWHLAGEAGGGSWNVPSRPRRDKHPTEAKHRWETTSHH